ncbi:MAG: phosphatase domain-containing protein [Myxococcota bacterium]
MSTVDVIWFVRDEEFRLLRLHRAAVLTAAALLLVSRAALADPAILLFPAIGQPGQVTVAGRVLKEAPSRGSSTLSRNLRRLMAPNWEGAPVKVAFAGARGEATSTHDGAFEVTFTAPAGKPFPPGLVPVEASVPGAVAKSAVEVVSPRAPFIVISDFDDTLALTHVTDKVKMVEAALLEDFDSQTPVAGMNALYRCLRQDKPAPPAFALVSGSPVQYVPRTARFLAHHQFPFFGLYLRDLGPGTLRDYKQPYIRQLLKTLPQRAVLVGDSGEHDPEVYAQMRTEFPGRVARIYIRDAGRTEEKKRFEGMVLFQHPREAAWDAMSQGLASESCVRTAFTELPQ